MKKFCEMTLLVFVAIPLIVSGSWADSDVAPKPSAMVYKSPTCGCCTAWIEHLEENGFEVSSKDIPDVGPVKRMNGVPAGMSSCHTAIIGGYFVEGHVPAEDIERLLRERPEIAGLAVPRMPIGSPGMEGPNPEPYSVFAIKEDGSTAIFSTHTP
ncbi:MAG: DUF411 domain-containing protein [Myxococcota bacterium]|jgi:hypothetical protein|nr:DUF411 domain-containing protein [Myxococcota bacterium]